MANHITDRHQSRHAGMTKEELKAIREELGMSQQELAEAIGLRDKSMICQRENGKRRVTGPEAKHIYQLLQQHRASKR